MPSGFLTDASADGQLEIQLPRYCLSKSNPVETDANNSIDLVIDFFLYDVY